MTRRLLRSPLTWILLVAGVLHFVGIGWGLPASEGWDNDGVAPRDFLAGIVETFTPGHFYTYPPVHLLILTVLTAPITIVALVKAPSLAANDVVHEIIKVPYMTANAYVARVLSVLMSLAIVVMIARIAELVRAQSTGDAADRRVKRAGWCAAAIAASNMSFTYYAHTSNLDVPYLFWAFASLLAFMRAVTRNDPKRFRRAFVLAVLSVATKDQAFALFVLSFPVALAVHVLAETDRERRRAIARQVAIAFVYANALFLVADAVVFNPTGFRARLEFLTGPASKDFVTFTSDATGRLHMLGEALREHDHFYPLALALLCAAGVVLEGVRTWRATSSRFAVTALPALAALSFTVFFDFTALRTDHRFFLPQSLLLAVYGGLALEPLVFAARRGARIAAQAAAAVAFAVALYACMAVDANLLDDPRYWAEWWLNTVTKPGDLIETYGLNVYLPRFPPWLHVVRVGPEPPDKRAPMPGIEEVQAPFERAPERNPKYIVLTGGWMWRYLINPYGPLEPGRTVPPTHAKTATDPEATRYFHQLTASEGEYHVIAIFKYESRFFPLVDIHASTAREVWVLERKPGR